MMAAVYVAGLAAVAVAVHVLLRRTGRQSHPSDWAWTIAAGVLWPLLLVGAIQAAAIWLAVNWIRRRRARVVVDTAEIAQDTLLVN